MLFLVLVGSTIGAFVGALRGGQVAHLADLPLRFKWVAFGCWLVQVVLFISPLATLLESWAAPIHVLSTALLAIVVVGNRHLRGVPLVGLGLALNLAVYLANGGFMPVAEGALLTGSGTEEVQALRDDGRVQKAVLMQPNTPLWFLGDVVPFAPVNKVFSPGDLIAALGMCVLVGAGMLPRQRAPRRDAIATFP